MKEKRNEKEKTVYDFLSGSLLCEADCLLGFFVKENINLCNAFDV